MKKKLLKKLKSEKGALDKVLVTLLLVIVGIVGIIGLENWASAQKASIQSSASTKISNINK